MTNALAAKCVLKRALKYKRSAACATHRCEHRPFHIPLVEEITKIQILRVLSSQIQTVLDAASASRTVLQALFNLRTDALK